MAVKRWGRRSRSRPPAGEAGRAQGASLDGLRVVRQRRYKRSWPSCVVLCSAVALDRMPSCAHCGSRRRRLSGVRRLSTGVESERTLPEPLKTFPHLVLTQCADTSSRADRPSKPCLLLSCYRSVGSLVLADLARSLAELRSNKTETTHHESRRRACLLQSIRQVFGDPRASPVAKSIEVGTRALPRFCGLFADRPQEGRQTDGSRADVVMSGAVESGRECGHGKIDAIDPLRKSAGQICCRATLPVGAWRCDRVRSSA
jgi:hypothetical protein